MTQVVTLGDAAKHFIEKKFPGRAINSDLPHSEHVFRVENYVKKAKC